MSEDLEIRKRIAKVVEGKLAPADLEEWLQAYAWDLSAGPAHGLAADAMRLLSEHANGDWTDDEVRDRLGIISRVYWFQQAPKVAWSDSVAVVIPSQQSAGAGTRRAVECV